MKANKIINVIPFCLLAACTPLKKPTEYPLATTKASIEQKAGVAREASVVTSWALSGAIAARNKNKSWTASLKWIQNGPANYQIHLAGPLSAGTVIIERNGAMVTYRDGPKTMSSNNAEQLLMKQTGIRLPVNHLYYWIRGLSESGSHLTEASSPVAQITQDGYTVQYLQYTRVNGVILPSKIKLEGHGVIIKVVIKQWKI